MFGLLGPNGAGKTTLVRVLATLLRPTAGHASVLGYDVVAEPLAVRRRIGLAGQFAAVDEELTGRENLEMVGRLYRLSAGEARARAADVLDRFSLTDAADRRVSTYSGGMRRRLDLGASLTGRPPVILLDEPTTGLDPRTRQELWDTVDELRRAGTTILLTTQYLEEADRLAQRIAIVDHGRIAAEGTTAELKARVGDRRPRRARHRHDEHRRRRRSARRPRRRRRTESSTPPPARSVSRWATPPPRPKPCDASTRDGSRSPPSSCNNRPSMTCSSPSPAVPPSPTPPTNPPPGGGMNTATDSPHPSDTT